MADLLLEIFSEEIPARMQKNALEFLCQKMAAAFKGGNAKGFVTPRRIAVIMEDLPDKQPDIDTELKGPKVTAPEQALAGFLKKTGLTQDKLEERDGVYYARIHEKGKATAELLKEVIEQTLADFPWPKSMRWGSGDTAWVRPLHSILCLFDGKIVPVEFAGIKAGNVTCGHRFLAPKAITIQKAADYEAALEKAFVIADRDKRKAEILKQAEAAAGKLGLALKEDAGLLEEVTGLVEWPVVLAGRIDEQYMDLPQEVLVSEMRTHQKYFALFSSHSPLGGESQSASASGTPRDAVGGKTKNNTPPDFSDKKTAPPQGRVNLAPYFLITANMKDADQAIIAGNERVLRARFADARFFWDQDRRKSLDDMAKGLEAVTYHAKLGSVADKVERIEKLAIELTEPVFSSLRGAQATKQSSQPQRHLSEKNLDRHAPNGARDDVKRATHLCKADLVSGMVGEFPELQGLMGRYYALHQGENPAVSDAIRDHYKPQGPMDDIPAASVSVCVALADKLDTLIALFALGEKPTGSKDPFALRRAALGVIRIILENDLRLPLMPLFAAVPAKAIAMHMAREKLEDKTEAALRLPVGSRKVGKYLTLNESAYEDLEDAVPANLSQQLYDFFCDRLKVQMKDQGIRHDVIAAVIANGDDDLVRIVKRAKTVQDFIETEDGKNLLAGYKRAANILAIEEKKDKTAYDATINASALKEPEEKALADALTKARASVEADMKKEDFVEVMRSLSKLRAPVDSFFNKIMVNCDDTALRENRLRLLASIRDAVNSVADFGRIEG